MIERGTVGRASTNPPGAVRRAGASIERGDKRPLPKGLRYLLLLVALGLVAMASGYGPDDAVNAGRDAYARVESEAKRLFFDPSPPRIVALPAPRPRVESTPPAAPRGALPPVAPPAAPLPPVPPPSLASDAPGPLLVRPPGAVPAMAPFPASDIRRYVGEATAAFERVPPAGPSAIAPPQARARELSAAARVGYGPARGLIARGFPFSAELRAAAEPADAVRYALDLLAHGQAFSRDPQSDFQGLASYFRRENLERDFAGYVFDALRDDERLRTTKAISDLIDLYNGAERGCGSLRRHVGLGETSKSDAAPCGKDLAPLLPARALDARATGLEESGFREGMLLLANALGVPGLPPPPAAAPPLPRVAAPPPPPAAAPPPPPPISSLIARPGDSAGPPLTVAEVAIDAYVARQAGELGGAKDDTERKAIFEKLNAAAAVGHRRARAALVGFYAAQRTLRDVVSAGDIVRYALDSLAVDAIWLEDSARPFGRLAGFFEAEKQGRVFAAALFNAIRDDARLRDPDKVHELLRVLFRVDGGCEALRALLDVHDGNAQATGHCGHDLRDAIVSLAEERGEAGQEKRAFAAGARRLGEEIGARP